MEMLTSKELAARWRIAPGTVANMRSQGRGPNYIKMGRGKQTRIMYPIAEIIAWEQAHITSIQQRTE